MFSWDIVTQQFMQKEIRKFFAYLLQNILDSRSLESRYLEIKSKYYAELVFRTLSNIYDGGLLRKQF